MKIIFLNTWHSKLKDELRTYIKQHLSNTTAFCFQEASDEDRAAYADLLTSDFILHTAERQEPGSSHYSNALYIRKGMPIIETGDLFLERTEGLNIGLAAYVTLQLPAKNLTICNAHGVPVPGHKLDTPARLLQSQTIIKAFADKEAVIIGGDFNLLPETESVQLFTKHGYRNLITDFAIATTRNRFAFERYPDSIQYYADYVFASSAVKVRDFVVPETIVSDHQPLEVVFDVS